MWQINFYSIPLFIAALISIVFAAAVWQRRAQSPLVARLFFTLSLDVVLLLLANGMELLSAQASLILFWAKIEYIAYNSIPLIWLVFIAAYSGYESQITLRRLVIISIIPVVDLLLVWTNEYHNLHWKSTGIQMIGSLVYFDRKYNVAFWVIQIYLQSILAFSVLAVIFASVRFSSVFRQQMLPLLLASLIPWAGNLLFITGLYPLPTLPATPLALAVACLPVGWALFRHRLFDVTPTAYDLVLRSMGDAVIVLDTQDRILDLNPVAEQMIGQSIRNVLGHPIEHFFSIDITQQYRGIYDMTTQSKFGEGDAAAYYDIRISPLHNRGGRLTGRVIVLRDITSIKNAEQTILDYAAKLEQSNHELDAFSYTVAHDLKAPLATINGYAEIISDAEGSAISETSRDGLQSIITSVYKMRDMINNLLLLARLRDDAAIATTEIDMTALARTLLERFSVEVEQRAIAVNIMADMPKSIGYTLWVEALLANLLDNAIKYLGNKNPSPQISIRAIAQGDVVRYEVSDNGVGIAAENQLKIFDMFTRLSSEETSGSGLGLAIVSRIARKLNGQVGVESEVGKGSTFWFTLPSVQK